MRRRLHSGGNLIAAVVVASAVGCGLGVAGELVPADGGPGPDASLPPESVPSDAATGADADAGEAPLDGAADGPCTADTVSDSLNCGACGHSCLGGACQAGRCQPAVFVKGNASLDAIDVTPTSLYYAEQDSGKIYEVPLATGVAREVVATGAAPHDLKATILGRIYWGDQNGAGLFIPDAGTTSSQSVTGGARAIVKTDGGLYAAGNGSIELFDLGLATDLVSLPQPGTQGAIDVDGANVYWSAGSEIRRVAYGGAQGAVEKAVDNLPGGSASSLAVGASFVFWTQGGTVYRAPMGATLPWPIQPLVTGEASPASIAVDGSGVYWIEMTKSTLRHVAPGPAPIAETLATMAPQMATPPPLPRLIALTPQAIYFACSGDGTVYRLAK